MSKYNIDNSIQTMDHASTIWRTNNCIMELKANGIKAPIPDLVEFLETVLWSYRDEKYKNQIKEINETQTPRGNTPNQSKRNSIIGEERKVMLTHRALMDLAYRKKFLPAAGSHQSDNYVIGANANETQ